MKALNNESIVPGNGRYLGFLFPRTLKTLSGNARYPKKEKQAKTRETIQVTAVTWML